MTSHVACSLQNVKDICKILGSCIRVKHLSSDAPAVPDLHLTMHYETWKYCQSTSKVHAFKYCRISECNGWHVQVAEL